jgi:general secretion pathway protein D
LFHSLIAIQAAKGNVNILSSPHILTTDNQEASISIVNQVPIPKTTETETGTLITTYEYKDAGITLKVTPKINEKGLVTMQLSLEVTDVGEKKTFDTEQVPFLKRNAQTSVVVQDGQTLVLGGLISENQSESRTGIPFLMDIPVIGYLFGTTTKSLNKTELVMLITPHVVRSREDVDKLTEQFEKNVDKLRKGMGIKVD